MSGLQVGKEDERGCMMMTGKEDEKGRRRAYFELVNESVSIEDIVSEIFEHLTIGSITQSKHVKRPVVHSLPQYSLHILLACSKGREIRTLSISEM